MHGQRRDIAMHRGNSRFVERIEHAGVSYDLRRRNINQHMDMPTFTKMPSSDDFQRTSSHGVSSSPFGPCTLMPMRNLTSCAEMPRRLRISTSCLCIHPTTKDAHRGTVAWPTATVGLESGLLLSVDFLSKAQTPQPAHPPPTNSRPVLCKFMSNGPERWRRAFFKWSNSAVLSKEFPSGVTTGSRKGSIVRVQVYTAPNLADQRFSMTVT